MSDNAHWLGLRPDDSKVSISHSKLMDWARRADMQYQVGWNDHVVIDGTRLVRHSDDNKPSDVALGAGWDDMADMLRQAGL